MPEKYSTISAIKRVLAEETTLQPSEIPEIVNLLEWRGELHGGILLTSAQLATVEALRQRAPCHCDKCEKKRIGNEMLDKILAIIKPEENGQ